MWRRLYSKKTTLKKLTRYSKNRKIQYFTRLKFIKFLNSDIKRFQERKTQRQKAYFGHRYRPPRKCIVSLESVFNRRCKKKYPIYHTLKKPIKSFKKTIRKVAADSSLNILNKLRIALVKNILDKTEKEIKIKLSFLILTLPKGVKLNRLFEYKTKLFKYFTNTGTEYLYYIELCKKKNLRIHVLFFQDIKNSFWKFKMSWNKLIGVTQGQRLNEIICNSENIKKLISFMIKNTLNIEKIGGSKMFTDSLVKYRKCTDNILGTKTKEKKKEVKDKKIKKEEKNDKSEITYKTKIEKQERN